MATSDSEQPLSESPVRKPEPPNLLSLLPKDLSVLDTNRDGKLSHLEITAGVISGFNALEQEGVRQSDAISKGLNAGGLTGIAAFLNKDINGLKPLLQALAPNMPIEMPNAADVAYIQQAARDAAHAIVNSTVRKAEPPSSGLGIVPDFRGLFGNPILPPGVIPSLPKPPIGDTPKNPPASVPSVPKDVRLAPPSAPDMACPRWEMFHAPSQICI